MEPLDDFIPQAACHDAPPEAPFSGGTRWVPVRTLGEHNRARILRHLLGLGEHDRYLRFGYPARDEQIAHYVERIDFARDEVFGIFNRRLEIVAMAHLAYPSTDDEAPASSAEFGVSVSEHLRGRGIGGRLFDHAILHARNRGIATLVIHALTENTPMLRIARRAGAIVQRTGSDADACLELPPVDLTSRLEEIVEDSAAEIDYSLKRQARQVGQWMDSVAEVSRQWIRADKGSPE